MSSIDPLNTSLFFAASAEAAKLKKREEKKENIPVNNAKTLFANLLNKTEQNEEFFTEGIPPEVAEMSFQDATTYLLDAVNVAGDILKKDGSLSAITDYRKAVSGFMRFVVKNSFDLSEHQTKESLDTKRGKRKLHNFYQIEVIDEKLDKLASDVLYNHADKLKILEKVNEINGILVDLIT